jgi:hypothetical protein
MNTYEPLLVIITHTSVSIINNKTKCFEDGLYKMFYVKLLTIIYFPISIEKLQSVMTMKYPFQISPAPLLNRINTPAKQSVIFFTSPFSKYDSALKKIIIDKPTNLRYTKIERGGTQYQKNYYDLTPMGNLMNE